MEVKVGTKFNINKDYWDPINQQWDISMKVYPARKSEDKLLNREIDDFNMAFSQFKKEVDRFIEDNPYPTYNEVYSFIYGNDITKAVKKETNYPEDFDKFVEFYIEEKGKLIPGKQRPITYRTEQKYRTIKNRVVKFFPGILVTEIDDDFRDEYSLMMSRLDYKAAYIIKELKLIKSFCKYANRKLSVNKEVLYWSFIETETRDYMEPIFTFEELEIIKNKEMPSPYLDRARDWLLISCYIGQRVGDFLSMNAENIIEEEFYVVRQEKGKKDVTIWLMPEVRKILEKYDGEFPRKISSQKYNDYIKKVCEICEFDEKIKGGKTINNRKVIDYYPKYELITSHIGRRTFVSLFADIIGKENVKSQTGHTTDRMVNLYNKTLSIDKAKKVKDSFNKINTQE